MSRKRKLPRRSMDEQVQEDLAGDDLLPLLRKAGLPDDYPALGPLAQQKARLHSLRCWYDLDRPDIFLHSLEDFLKAHFLWTYFYLKPHPLNRGVYTYDDPTNKEDMLRGVFSPSDASGEPAMSVVSATRRMGKTQILVVDSMPFICITRPFSICLISESENKRTMEEIRKMKRQVEQNDRIHQDFGGSGEMFPRNTKQGVWSAHELEFIHHSGSRILGHSLGSAQRGRGPIYGVIDDAEDENNSFNKEWRRWLFQMILGTYKNMFGPGGVFCMIGTPVHEGSCLNLAMKGMIEGDENPQSDIRFKDFRRIKVPLIYKDSSGKWQSHQPQRISVAVFLRRMQIDPVNTMREILCEPASSGMQAFPFDTYRHGFMQCSDTKGDYFLDLYTGERMSWEEFIRTTRIVGAGDLADGQSIDSDPGACVYVGVRGSTVYVLDAYVKRCHAQDLIDMAFSLAEPLSCEYFGWETSAMQTVIYRVAQEKAEQLRREGRLPPVLREIENARKNKIRRILTMIGLFTGNRIRFMHFEPLTDEEGRIHTPAEHPRREMHLELLEQVRTYTDEGRSGHDDAIDALEMAVRILYLTGMIEYEVPEREPEEIDTDTRLERWRELGMSFPEEAIPEACWTPAIRERILQQQDTEDFPAPVAYL